MLGGVRGRGLAAPSYSIALFRITGECEEALIPSIKLRGILGRYIRANANRMRKYQ